jgi:hypothetical protein
MNRSTIGLGFFLSIAFGTIVGLAISRVTWGYFLWPDRLATRTTSVPAEISVFRMEGDQPKLVDDGAHSEFLQIEMGYCERDSYCSVGSVLRQLGGESLLKLPRSPEKDLTDSLKTVKASVNVGFIRSGSYREGVLIRFRDGDRLLALLSTELSNDHYGYLEAILPPSGTRRAVDYRYFYFDIAGLEILTPAVLVAGCSLVFSVFTLIVYFASMVLFPRHRIPS